ncbi:TonB-dependent Receptor Plug Domain protein [compost metagenome]
MKQKILFMVIVLVLFCFSVFAQNRTISGKVTSADDGLPIPGANIRPVGSGTPTTTNSNGEYSISVSESVKRLRFSFIGYEELTKQITESVLNVRLNKNNTDLAEVIVTGYGILQTKTSNTGAQASVNGDAVANRPNGNFTNALQGKIAGLNVVGNSGKPGDAGLLRVRGISSLTAGNDPLIQIDGVDVINLNSLNADDIENVTLLKDPASTAIYGSRAANGVLLITTKKGKAGDPKFTYSFQYGTRQRLKDNFDLMNVDEKLRYEYNLGYVNPEIKRILPTISSFPTNSTLFTLTDGQRETLWNALKENDHSWFDDLYRHGKVRSHQLGLSGASDKMHYYVNLNNYKEDGISIGSGFKRTGARVNSDYQAKSWLKIGTNLSGAYVSETTVRESYNVLNPFGAVYFVNSYEPLRLPDGSWNPTVQSLNPVETIVDAPASAGRTYFNGSTFAEFTPIQNLTIKSSIGIDYYKRKSQTFYVPGSMVDEGIFGTASPGYKEDLGNETFLYISTNTINYKKSLAEDHQVNFLAGFEFLKNQYSYYNFSSRGYPSIDPHYDTQNNGAKPNSVTSRKESYAQESYFGRLGYSYKNRYFIDGSLRQDGSSRFGLNNRYGVFWSAGLAWNAIDESFFEPIKSVFSTLKVRGSIGKTGNNQIGDFDSQGIYSFGKYNSQSTIAETVLGNNRLGWESSLQKDVGLDFSLFNARIRSTFDYYHRTSSNLLFKVPKSLTTGFQTRTENVGEMVNSGIELQLDGDVIKNENLLWTMTFNFSYNKNKISKLYGNIDMLASTSTYTRLKVGQPINTFYLLRFAGINDQTGEEQWYDNNGTVFSDFSKTGGNAVLLQGKSPLPKYYGSIGTNVAFKGFTLSASLYYNFGNYIYNLTWRDMLNNGNDPSTSLAAAGLDYWKKPGDKVQFSKPVLGQPQPDADKYLQKGDYIRLRDLTIGYDLPKSWITRLKMQSARVFLQSTNLFTYAPEFKGNPEIGVGNNERPVNEFPGITSYYPYTQSKAFTFGTSITF